MKIYNQDKTETIENPDLDKGYLVHDEIISKIIPAVEAVEEKFHYEYTVYPNGGRDRFKVVDVVGVEAQPETYEYEEIQVYIPYTDFELKKITLNKLDKWFKNQYREYNEMLTRRKELGIEDTIVDEFRNKTYHNLAELYEEAEVVAREIRNLREK